MFIGLYRCLTAEMVLLEGAVESGELTGEVIVREEHRRADAGWLVYIRSFRRVKQAAIRDEKIDG